MRRGACGQRIRKNSAPWKTPVAVGESSRGKMWPATNTEVEEFFGIAGRTSAECVEQYEGIVPLTQYTEVPQRVTYHSWGHVRDITHYLQTPP